MIETLRLFVALAIPREVKETLAALRGELEPGLPALRWVRPEGIHLTLAFLGEVAENRLETIRTALAGCLGELAPMELETEGVGVFPHLRAPRVFWVGIPRPPAMLPRLQRQVEEALAGLGFQPEGRAFRPHLTIGRFRRSLRRNELGLLETVLERDVRRPFGLIPVQRLSLFRSTLLPAGAVYEEVGGWPLSGLGGTPDEVRIKPC